MIGGSGSGIAIGKLFGRGVPPAKEVMSYGEAIEEGLDGVG